MKKLLQYTFILLFAFCFQYQGIAQHFGYTTWDNHGSFQSNYITWWKIETGASDSGNFTHVGFYQNSTSANGNLVRMGIYEDNGSNSPSNKLVEVPSFTITLDSYNQIELDTPIAFDPSTVYWVAFHCNTQTGFGQLNSGSTPIKYKSVNFGATWPNPAGSVSGYTEEGGNIFVIGNGSIVLPVELLLFKLDRKNDLPNLKWSTATEINNKGWNIQRSQNGFTWTTIDWIDGYGDSYSQLDYHYLDTNPMDGINFYRLEQLDYDGEKSYSDIRSFEHKTKVRSIYPNPAADKISLLGYSNSTVTVNNMQGQTVLSANITQGESLNVVDLIPGNYLLIVKENENVSTHQFIKK